MTPDAPDVAEMVAWLESQATWWEGAASNTLHKGKDCTDDDANADMARAIAERLRARGGT